MAKTARKTVEVGTLLYRVNYFLKGNRSTADERDVMAAFIEGVLHDTGNYWGYAYLPAADYPGEVDGLGTRRRYFVGSKIEKEYNDAEALTKKLYGA